MEIQSIDIGNDGSAFVEVLVRRGEQVYNKSNEDDGFRTLLPAASFLTPMESRNEENISRVRMFGTEKLSQDLQSQKWDQFKVNAKNQGWGNLLIRIWKKRRQH